MFFVAMLKDAAYQVPGTVKSYSPWPVPGMVIVTWYWYHYHLFILHYFTDVYRKDAQPDGQVTDRERE